jgi:hypothetical protein
MGGKELKMKNVKMTILTLVIVCAAAIPVAAGDFDGSKPLLCSVISVMECTRDGGCQGTTAENVALPQFLRIDFQAKIVTAAGPGDGAPPSAIERMERVDGKLVLQGAEDGLEGVRDGVGWTTAISEETGRAILTASGEEVAFVVFGACIPF